jgi:N-formylglutamate deformylase
MVGSALRRQELVALEEAARSLGASFAQRFLGVLVPAVRSCRHTHPAADALVRRYGKPAEHRHSIQIEINRKLYMNEQTLDLDQAGYLRLTTDLKALVEQLMATDPRTL